MSHGNTGRTVIEMLSEYPNISVEFIYRAEHNTRTNYLLNEKSGDSALITEKGVQLSDDDIDAITAKLEQNTENNDFLALSGDASNYHDPFVYNIILEKLRAKQYRVFLDTSGETLKKCIKYVPFLIKPNLDELSYLVGREVAERVADEGADVGDDAAGKPQYGECGDGPEQQPAHRFHQGV